MYKVLELREALISRQELKNFICGLTGFSDKMPKLKDILDCLLVLPLHKGLLFFDDCLESLDEHV